MIQAMVVRPSIRGATSCRPRLSRAGLTMACGSPPSTRCTHEGARGRFVDNLRKRMPHPSVRMRPARSAFNGLQKLIR